ncbi:MAG: Trm112 family protein [Candidatus Omnitrophica bacterium]|nr:Trm112 family protein [Candidatus Omnitrophota bacterium]
MKLDEELLDILACPKCKSRVKLVGEKIVCVSAPCGLKYPIREGIPVMLIEEAEKPA